MKLNESIKYYRNKLDMTQKQLADKAEISLRALSNYEKGLREPSIEILLKLAKALNLTIKELKPDISIWEEFDQKVDTNKLKEEVDEIHKNEILVKGVVTNNDLCIILNVDSKKIFGTTDLNKKITIDNLQRICEYLNIDSKEEEAFLYSNYLYKTNDDIFRVVAFYYYLKDYHGIDLQFVTESFLEAGENIIERYNLKLNLGYAMGRSNELLVAKIIYVDDISSQILHELYDFEDSYHFELEKLNFEEKYKLTSKLSSNLKYELHKIAKERKDIQANFYENI